MMPFITQLESVFSWVLSSSWQGAIIVLLIVAVQLGLRKIFSAKWRYVIWSVLLLRLLLPWTPPNPLSLLDHVPEPGMLVERMEAIPFMAPPSLEETSSRTEITTVDNPLAITAPATFPSLNLMQGLTLTWAIVTLTFLLSMAWRSGRLLARVKGDRVLTDTAILKELEQCKQEMEVSAWLAVVESSSVQGPALMGWIRPRLLTPPGLLQAATPLQRRHIFLHELAHLKRGDIWSGWLIHLAVAVHWFNPLIWWARKRMLQDRELACDALVLEHLEEDARSGYGHTMLDLIQNINPTRFSPGMAGIVENKSNLKKRITMIGKFKPARRSTTLLGLFACIAFGLMVMPSGSRVTAEVAEVDILVTGEDITAFTAGNGGTMISVKITNNSLTDQVVEVRFIHNPQDGSKVPLPIGRGSLLVPARGHATEAIPWIVKDGEYTVTAHIDHNLKIAETNETNNMAARNITFKKGAFSHGEEQKLDANRQEFLGRLATKLEGERLIQAPTYDDVDITFSGQEFKFFIKDTGVIGGFTALINRSDKDQKIEIFIKIVSSNEKNREFNFGVKNDLKLPAQEDLFFTLPVRFKNGAYSITAQIDPNNIIKENNELNNRVQKHFLFFYGKYILTAEKMKIHEDGSFTASGIHSLPGQPQAEFNIFSVEDMKINEDGSYTASGIHSLPGPPQVAFNIFSVEDMKINEDGSYSASAMQFGLKGSSLSNIIAEDIGMSLDGEMKAVNMRIAKTEQNQVQGGKKGASTPTLTATKTTLPKTELSVLHDCARGLKQLGLMFRLCANESKGGIYPALSSEKGTLMFAWGDEGEGRVPKKFISNPRLLDCPKAMPGTGNTMDDHHYVYLSHVLRDDESVALYAEMYALAHSDDGSPKTMNKDLQQGNRTLFRIREGIERFFITDITVPSAASTVQSEIPLMIEWPDHHDEMRKGRHGGNVLFMDGHVEYVAYGNWPMTKKTIGHLRKMAELPAID